MATGPSYLVLVVKLANRDSDYLARQILPSLGSSGAQGQTIRRFVQAIVKITESLVSGAHRGNLWASVVDGAGTLASGTITCTQANASGDTITFTMGAKTIVLTEAVDFARGASDTACATALAAAINAHGVIKRLFVATSAVGVVTITAKFPTNIPHAVVMTTSDGTAFALSQVASGTWGAAQFFLRHFQAGDTP